MRGFGMSLMAVVAVLLAACTGAPEGVEVQPIEAILGSDIVVEPDASGTVAILRVDTTIPVVCAVVYGIDEGFGSIATDDDMAGGAHRDHAPRMTGLEPDTEYQYVLQGSDADGTLYRSDVMTFRTPAAAQEPVPGRNVAPQATIVEVSSEFSGSFAAANAVDGDLGTEWSSAGDGDEAGITLDLGQDTDIVGVRWRTRQMSDGSAIVRSYTVTVDGGETLGPFPIEGDDAIAELQVHGRQLRFDAAETTGGNTGAVEIEVYASDG